MFRYAHSETPVKSLPYKRNKRIPNIHSNIQYKCSDALMLFCLLFHFCYNISLHSHYLHPLKFLWITSTKANSFDSLISHFLPFLVLLIRLVCE